jgi:chemotaxis protein histidine kinase CheA
LIGNQSIALRLTAGSEEAGYLAQIFPLPQTPTVVIIKNGELKEYITPGVSKEDFTRRVQTAFNASVQAAQPAAAPSVSTPPQPAQNDAQEATAPQQADRSESVRRVLAERAARLQAEKEKAERKAREARAKAKEKAKAEAEAGANTEAARAYEQAELVKKKKKKDDEERQRILKRIADDKAERRERAAERERQRIGNQKIGDLAASLASAPETKLPSTTKISETTALQVRLFDGSTIRSRFQTKSSLKEVRAWVDEKRHDGSLPYTFKQVLTPLPNKNIDATEESKDLAELGLAPSSTLVLIPVTNYTSAYEGSSGSILTRIIRLIVGLFTWVLGLLGLGGNGGSQQSSGSEAQDPAGTGAQGRSRVQGFQNPNDRRRDQQLYNGNSVSHTLSLLLTACLLTFPQLNFEPRPDEEDEK